VFAEREGGWEWVRKGVGQAGRRWEREKRKKEIVFFLQVVQENYVATSKSVISAHSFTKKSSSSLAAPFPLQSKSQRS